MQEHLDQLTATVREDAAALQRRYRVGAVHRLRVTIRRIRSILKQDGGPRARRLRKTWGALAAISNEARDWDVFLRQARELLAPADYQAFRRHNRRPVRHSREAVKSLLRSEPWRLQLADWEHYLGGRKPSRRSPAQSLQATLEAAGAALARALDENDEKAWHRFRIALKDLRYVAESAARPSAAQQEVIALCLPLQAALGAWHDSVIQLQLLAGLPPHPAHQRLRPLLRGRRRHALNEARALLAGQSLIQPRRSAAASATPARASPASRPGRARRS